MPQQIETLEQKVLRLAKLKGEIKALESQEETLAADVMAEIFQTPEVDHYAIPNVGKMAIQTKTTTTISREKLIAAGVSIDKIVSATDRNVSKPFVRWYPAKE